MKVGELPAGRRRFRSHPRVGCRGSGVHRGPRLTTSPPDRLRRHCPASPGNGFGRSEGRGARSRAADGALKRRVARGRLRPPGSSRHSHRSHPRVGAAGGTRGNRRRDPNGACIGLNSRSCIEGVSGLGPWRLPAPGMERAGAEREWTLEGNKAHGRIGCRLAGNGDATLRTHRRSKALKSAARVVSKGPLGSPR